MSTTTTLPPTGGQFGVASQAKIAASKISASSFEYGQVAMAEAGMETVFDGRVRVRRAENGFLVDISAAPGARVKSYVAANVEEVNSHIMAAMVDFRLSEGW